MYSKVINPEKHGKAERHPIVFNNKGSSARLGNYLEKELDLATTPDGKVFFNNKGDFSKEEMVNAIDNNVKGLTANDDKFYSLVLSPSQAELEHINNDTEKLKEFTIACMENYAQNFVLKTKDGSLKQLSEKDLVWFANIEYDRTFKGDDDEVKRGEKKQGEKKDGLNTHIHVTVSARDDSMKTTLNPRTNDKNRFSILNWAEKNQEAFDKKFGYDSPKKTFVNQEKQEHNKFIALERQLMNFEQKYNLSMNESAKIRELGRVKNYSEDFKTNMKELGKELRKNPLHHLKGELGKEQWDKLLASKIDDYTREGRLEKTLSKMKENNNLSENSEKSIRKIAEAKELSSDFLGKLQAIQNHWKLSKNEKESQMPKSLSKNETAALLSATLDDRTPEGLLKSRLEKLQKNHNLSDNAIIQIKDIAQTKNMSNDFFEKLKDLNQLLEIDGKIEKGNILGNEMNKTSENISFETFNTPKELLDKHIDLLNSAESFEPQTGSSSILKHFFIGNDDGQGQQDESISEKSRKKIKRIRDQNRQQGKDNDISF